MLVYEKLERMCAHFFSQIIPKQGVERENSETASTSSQNPKCESLAVFETSVQIKQPF